MRRLKPFLTFGVIIAVFMLSGCSNMVVLDPKGPVGEQQKDLILYSIGFMTFILLVVYGLFAFIVYKYRDHKNHKGYDPDNEGSHLLETIWWVIPIIIVIALSIPTVKTIYSLEGPPEETKDQKPLVIHATSVNWKWVFSYPEQDIETVNYLHIPEDRPVLFKLTSADSMASFWIPALGGQKYAMAGMETELYLQADEQGTFEGRNSNFTGEGFTDHTFEVHSLTDDAFDKWADETKSGAPELTKEQYDKLMLPGHVKEMTFSSTHLEWVNHADEADYAVKTRERLGYEPKVPHSKEAKEERKKLKEEKLKEEKQQQESESHGDSHAH
ncbi:cytochrome aa3 quinol oxidase subunit II [Fictibacillus nanhaiensis]|nr:cytochrome aa3 quinol oxidase subunit II [Fictibacillus nanhaiensis]MBY6038135.1 cytochrome aa3 quinol oxidase subunit II [Fictibacillus nanhaiensis]